MVLSSVRKQNISAQLAAQLAPSSKIISVSSICAKYGAETGEDARHSQTVASCRGYSETVLCSAAVLQCAEIVMTSPLLLCSYLRTRCPRAPPRSRRCSGGRIVSAHTAAQLHLHPQLPLHLNVLLTDPRPQITSSAIEKEIYAKVFSSCT